MENKYPKTQNAVDEAGAWLLTGKRYKKGGGIENKIIGIAKTHPYSTETETYYKPIDKNLPSKFYNELGIVLENDKDFVEIVEIQFDTRKLITQGWHVEEDEPYFGKEQANDISELSKELQDWLVENLLSSIKIQKELIANSTKAKLIKDLLEKTGKTKKECEEIVDRYNQIDNTKMAKGGKIVWVGDMPLDIDGREELTKEEAERLAKEWKEKGYDDVIIEDYAKGGNLATTQMDYDQILEILKDKIDDTVEDLYSTYENSNDAVGEEVESKSRDGFIPYTNGGYSSRWFEYSNYLEGSGIGLPTKSLDDKIEEFRKNSREYAKERFEEDYPEIVKELGIENIDYNSLYNAGYGDEAEELDEYEREDDDSVMMEIQALYYNPQNDRGEDGKHTIRLNGVVNLEAPYHRTGNLEDFIEKTFTFSSYKDLEDKLDKFLAQIKSWFEGDMYSENSKELKIKKMSKGGELSDVEKEFYNNPKLVEEWGDGNVSFENWREKTYPPTFKVRQEIRRLKGEGYRTVIVNGFDESIGYALGRNWNDYEVERNEEGNYTTLYAKGGKIGFDGLAKKVAKNYSGKKVPKKFQNQYGKTYSPAEAKEVGDKVAGSVYKMQQAKKMAKGGLITNQSEKHLMQVLIGLGMKSKSIYDKNKPYFDEEDRELLRKMYDRLDEEQFAKGGEIKEEDYLWDKSGKKYIVNTIEGDTYYLDGFNAKKIPFSKTEVEKLTKSSPYAKGGEIGDKNISYNVDDLTMG